MPLRAIARNADIKQLGDGAVYRVGWQWIKDIMVRAHKNRSPLARGGNLKQ